MKFSLIIVLATTLCASSTTVQAANDSRNCLDSRRNNAESLCRKECEHQDDEVVAFSVSMKPDDTENDDHAMCRCYKNIDGVGTYTGSGSREFGYTCFSMARGGEFILVLRPFAFVCTFC